MQSRLESLPSFRHILPTLTVTLVLVFALLVFSRSAAAGTNSIFVWGKVVDAADNPIDGAHVVITIVQTGVTRTYDTGSDGMFGSYPDIQSTEYSVGNTLLVESTSSLGYKSNQTTITQAMDDNGEANIWVEYDTAIPEFGSFAGFVIAAFAIGAVSVVALGRKRK